MTETKNDPQQAIQFASGLIMPSMQPYSSSAETISTSNGSAVTDIKSILNQTKSLMKTFENSVEADAKNMLKISDTYEKANQETKQVIEGGK